MSPVLAFVVGLYGPICGNAAAQQTTSGSDEFRIACASCHGVDGTGNGSVAQSLSVRPSDLTTLAKRNNGVYPAARVSKIIDGRESMAAHGDRDMPVWGIRFLMDFAVKYGEVDSEQIVQQRITKLVEHIQSMQED